MKPQASSSALDRFLVSSACFVVIIAGMRASQPVLVPFFLAVFIAVISTPSLFWMTSRKVPRGLAILILVSAIIGIGTMLGALVGSSITSFVRVLPDYKDKLKSNLAEWLQWFSEHGIELPESELLDYFDPGAAMQLVANMFTELSSVLGNTFLILIAVIFMLLEVSSFHNKLDTAFKGDNSKWDSIIKFTDSLKRYMAIKTWMSFVTGGLVAIWLSVVGVDYPLLWGLLAFLLNYVPNIGSFIAAIPALLFALVQLGPGSMGVAAIGYLVINLVIGNAIEPRFMGRGLGLSTLVVFLSLVFWGWVLGPVGMLLSVPLTMTLKIALESNKDAEWIAVMLGP